VISNRHQPQYSVFSIIREFSFFGNFRERSTSIAPPPRDAARQNCHPLPRRLHQPREFRHRGSGRYFNIATRLPLLPNWYGILTAVQLRPVYSSPAGKEKARPD